MLSGSLPLTAIQAVRYFSNPDTAHAFLVKMRWPEGVSCPHCGSTHVGPWTTGKRKLANCKAKGCKKQFTAKVGTVMQDSALPIEKWLTAFWLIVNAKNGISSHELHRAIGVTQKTAWFLGHRIRLAIQMGSFRKLGGVVQADESFIGGAARFMHKSAKERRGIVQGSSTHKSIVMALLQRKNRRKGHSVIRAEVVPFLGREVATSTVRKYTLKGSEVHTDSAHYYSDLYREFEHKVVDHAVSYVNEGVHTNGLENFWCLLKRTIKGTYVFCAPFHLHRYLGEQVFRFNERGGNDQERFLAALKGYSGKYMSYQKLIGCKQAA